MTIILKEMVCTEEFSHKFIEMCQSLNKLVETFATPSLLLTYYVDQCKKCRFVENSCLVVAMEQADIDLFKIPHKFGKMFFENEFIQISMIQQLLLCLHVLFQNDIVHGDVKIDNFLAKKVDNLKGTFFEYNVGNDTFYVENFGFVFVFSDFGMSRKLNKTTYAQPFNFDMFNLMACFSISTNTTKLLPVNRLYWQFEIDANMYHPPVGIISAPIASIMRNICFDIFESEQTAFRDTVLRTTPINLLKLFNLKTDRTNKKIGPISCTFQL
jgi:serine/threonine protein kinase